MERRDADLDLHALAFALFPRGRSWLLSGHIHVRRDIMIVLQRTLHVRSAFNVAHDGSAHESTRSYPMEHTQWLTLFGEVTNVCYALSDGRVRSHVSIDPLARRHSLFEGHMHA